MADYVVVITIFTYTYSGLLPPSLQFYQMREHLNTCVRGVRRGHGEKPLDDRERGGRALPQSAIIKGDYSHTVLNMEIHPIVYHLCMAGIKVISTFLASVGEYILKTH